jgi:hypothetical protein
VPAVLATSRTPLRDGLRPVAEALTTFEIEVLVVDLDVEVRAGIRAAQVRQVMVNTAPPGGPCGRPAVAAAQIVIMQPR